MVLGSYYLTIRRGAKGEGMVVTGIAEALPLISKTTSSRRRRDPPRIKGYGLVRTSLGRMIFNEILPPSRHITIRRA